MHAHTCSGPVQIQSVATSHMAFFMCQCIIECTSIKIEMKGDVGMVDQQK